MQCCPDGFADLQAIQQRYLTLVLDNEIRQPKQTARAKLRGISDHEPQSKAARAAATAASTSVASPAGAS